jgi:hypothetical protein
MPPMPAATESAEAPVTCARADGSRDLLTLSLSWTNSLHSSVLHLRLSHVSASHAYSNLANAFPLRRQSCLHGAAAACGLPAKERLLASITETTNREYLK